MSIVGVEEIYYGVENLEDSIRFHEDLGLERVESGASGADFRLRNDTMVHIRRADDGGLPPPKIDWLPHLNRSTARRIVWGVESRDSLQAIGAELSKDRKVVPGAEGVIDSADDSGFQIGFTVTRRKMLSLELPVANTVGNCSRLNRVAEGTIRQRVSPYRMGHIVYWVKGDLDGPLRFYIERLGFRLTDNLTPMKFLRCSGSLDHHSLLLQREQDFCGFQHVAYEVKDFDEVMMAGTYLEGQGWKTNTGPLRHNIGSSCSWYFWNPAGGAVEVYSDMDCADDNWIVRNIDPADPSFYGASWAVRPGKRRARPAEWIDD